MTKARPPLSIDAALARIAGQLPGGWEAMGRIVNRADRTCRNWGDPDTPEQVPMDCAVLLDIAYQEEGGQGFPILECYALQLEAAAISRSADRVELSRLASDAIRECGEANAAIVAASRPGAGPNDRRDAMREVEEALDVLKRTLPLLQETRDDPPPAEAQPP